MANLPGEPNLTAELTSTPDHGDQLPAGLAESRGGRRGAQSCAARSTAARSPAPETRRAPRRPAADLRGPRRRGASGQLRRLGTHPLLRGTRCARCPDSRSHEEPDSRCRAQPTPQTPPPGRREHSAPCRRPAPAHTQDGCSGVGRGVAGGESFIVQGDPESLGGLTGNRLTPGTCFITGSGLDEICRPVAG